MMVKVCIEILEFQINQLHNLNFTGIELIIIKIITDDNRAIRDRVRLRRKLHPLDFSM